MKMDKSMHKKMHEECSEDEDIEKDLQNEALADLFLALAQQGRRMKRESFRKRLRPDPEVEGSEEEE